MVRALKVVCRCNSIKYRSIERAIQQGACSLRDVAARTTATTGQCGGSCTALVQKILGDLAPQHECTVETVTSDPLIGGYRARRSR